MLRMLTAIGLSAVVAIVISPCATAQVVVDMPPPPSPPVEAPASDEASSESSNEPQPDPAYRHADVGWLAINRYAGFRHGVNITTARLPGLYGRPYNRVYYGPPIGIGYPYFGGVFHGVRFFSGHQHHGGNHGHGFHHGSHGHFGFHHGGVRVRVKF